MVADGTPKPIEASSTLLGSPSIHVNLVSTLIRNFIGWMLSKGAIGIKTHDKIVLLDINPHVNKIVEFTIN